MSWGETFNVGGRVASGGGSSLITPSLTVSSYSVIQGQGVFFDASATTAAAWTSEPFHDLVYRWEVSDASSATWAYGTLPGVKLKNIMFGPIANYAFPSAGSYTVTLYVYMRLSDGSLDTVSLTSSTITVTSDDAYYSGTNTIAIANGSTPVAGVGGVPSGAICVNSGTWSTVAGYMTAGKRVLLKGGDTWTVTGFASIAADNVTVGSYGGTQANLSWAVDDYAFYINGSGRTGFTLRDVKCDGVSASSNKYVIGGDTLVKSDITLNNVEAYSVGCGVSLSSVSYLSVLDCNFHDLLGGSGNVGVFAAATTSLTSACHHIAVQGTAIRDVYAIEHNIRIAGFNVIIANNSLRQAGASGKQLCTLRGITGVPDSTWSGVWAEKLLVCDNDFDGGSTGTGMGMQFAPTNTTTNEQLRDAICERNYFHGIIGPAIGTEVMTGMTIRNNLFDIAATGGAEAIWVIAQNTVGVAAPVSTYIYNNTWYSRHSGIAVAFVYVGKSGSLDYPTGTAITNNLLYAPSASSGAQISTGASGSYYTLSNNSSNAQITGTAPGFTIPPTSTFSTWKPTSGYALAAGVYVKGESEDFSHTAYTSTTREIGAVHA